MSTCLHLHNSGRCLLNLTECIGFTDCNDFIPMNLNDLKKLNLEDSILTLQASLVCFRKEWTKDSDALTESKYLKLCDRLNHLISDSEQLFEDFSIELREELSKTNEHIPFSNTNDCDKEFIEKLFPQKIGEYSRVLDGYSRINRASNENRQDVIVYTKDEAHTFGIVLEQERDDFILMMVKFNKIQFYIDDVEVSGLAPCEKLWIYESFDIIETRPVQNLIFDLFGLRNELVTYLEL